MLEVLYASGLRVSELVRLKLAEVSFDMGVVRVSARARRSVSCLWVRSTRLARALFEGRPAAILKKRASDYVFVTGAHPMTRQAFWHLIKKRAR